MNSIPIEQETRRAGRLLSLLLTGLLLFAAAVGADETDATSDDVDYLALAALMMRDGNLFLALALPGRPAPR